MGRRYKICQKVALVGLAIVGADVAVSNLIYLNLERIGTPPALLLMALRVLLALGSALTVAGILLGMYYKGRFGGPKIK